MHSKGADRITHVNLSENIMHDKSLKFGKNDILFYQSKTIARDNYHWITDHIPSIDSSLSDVMVYTFNNSDDVKKTVLVIEAMQSMIKSLHQEQEETNVTEEDNRLAATEICSALSDKQNWQQRLMVACEKYKGTNPVVVWIIEKVILVIAVGIIVGISVNAITSKSSSIREAPDTSSPILYEISEAQEIKITGDIPYYYAIEYENTVTQEVITGYISKRSVKTTPKSEIT